MHPQEAAVIRALRATNASIETFDAVLAVLTQQSELGSVRNLPETVGPNTDANAGRGASTSPAPIAVTARDTSPVTDTVTVTPGAMRTRKWRAKAAPPSSVTASPLPSPQKIDQIIINDLQVDQSGDASQVTLLAEQVTRMCGKRVHHLEEELARHLADGIPGETILATIRIVNRRKGNGVPGSARYYAKEIRMAHRQMRLPLPSAAMAGTGPPCIPFAERWEANTRKQIAERAAMEARAPPKVSHG